ncbi:MAG: ROK family protein [Acidimicrobiales bacterium]
MSGPLHLGIDIGGTKVLGVALDADADVVAEARVPTPHDAADPPASARGKAAVEVADAVGEVVARLHAALGAGRGRPAPGGGPVQLLGAGVGVPGMLDRRGVLRFAPNLQGASGADVAGLVSARVGDLPVVVENDANCAAIAEHQLGAAAEGDHVLVVTLGTGIGGAVVSGGSVLVGSSGFAGEVGHMIVDRDGPPCACGRRGCWERYASGGGLGRLAREAAYAGQLHEVVALAGGDPEAVRGEHVTRAALDGDAGALGVMEELGWWVALGLANLTAILDPSRIVLGGGLVEAGEILLAPTRRSFAELVEGGSVRPPIEIVPAALGERAGAVGAALASRAGGLG